MAATTAAPQANPFSFDTSKMVGFEVLTAEDGATDATNMVVIEYDGPIAFPMAENLQTIWEEVGKNRRFEKVLLRLNSPGGSDVHGVEAIEILKEIRERVSLITLVGENDLCASMCIAVFIQGETRYASPASSWMFHGASRFMSNIPSLSRTKQYFNLFNDRAIDTSFINFLFENRYVTTPGAYWISGGELAEKSNIVTKLLPNWRPAEATPGPLASILGGI